MEIVTRTIRYKTKDGSKVLVEQYKSPYGIGLWRYGVRHARPETPFYTPIADTLRTRPSIRTLRSIAADLTLEYDSKARKEDRQ